MDAVDQVLVQRARQQRKGLRGGLAAAMLLHGGVLAAVLLLPAFRSPSPALDYVPVTIIPAQALGVERPRARPRPPAPAPEPPRPAAPEPPAPEAKPEPKPPEPAATKPRRPEPEPETAPAIDRRPVLRNVEERTLPAPDRRRPADRDSEKAAAKAAGKRAPEPRGAASQGTAGAGGVADIGKGDEIGRRGSAAGSPLGSSAFGSSIAGLEDPDFGYGYYIDRLLQLIDANWTRPPVGGEVKTVIYFRIQKGGAITDLKVAQPSGYNSFDLAALRAVQNAAPFPALPASYRHDSLGVNLIVH